MNIIYSAFILIFIVCLSTRLRQLIQARNNAAPSPKSYCLSTILIIFTLIFAGISVIGHHFWANSYYDFLLMDLMITILTWIWIGALAATFLTDLFFPPTETIIKIQDKPFSWILKSFSLIVVLGWGVLFIFGIPNGVERVNGLISGPQIHSGTIESKRRSVDRTGTNYYLEIDATNNQTPDSQWWHTLEPGQQIQYAVNPHNSKLPHAFHSQKLSFTGPGLLTIGILSVLLLGTGRLAIDGLLQKRAHNFVRSR